MWQRETSSQDRQVNPEMIRLARESRGLIQGELATKLGVSQGHFSKVEAGIVVSQRDLVEGLSRVLDFPPEFFFQIDRVYGPSTSEFYHRKRKSAQARTLDQIHANINIRRIHLGRLLRSVEPPPCAIPKIDPEEFDGDVGEIARAVRSAFQVPKGPIRNVIEIIEDAGGIVIKMPFDSRFVDAVSWWVPGLPPVFYVNDSMPADRERLTLCHELGHLVMHQIARPDMEDEANKFAAEFLMPADEIRPHLREVSLQSLSAMKPYWKVSMQALLKRAADLETITPARASYLWALIAKNGYKLKEPAELDFPNEEASLLGEILESHITDLKYDLPQLAKLFAVYERQVVSDYHVMTPKVAMGHLRRVK